MGLLSNLFSRKRPRHARGSPDSDDVDADAPTRILSQDFDEDRSDEPSVRPHPAPSRRPVEESSASEERTELRPVEPQPRPRPQPTPPIQRRDRDEGGANATILTPAVRPRRTPIGVLVCVDGPIAGHVCRVYDGENVIGREGDPDPLPDQSETMTISRKHALLKAEAGCVAIEPLRPENATFVNEQPIDKAELLQHGDRIRLAATESSTFVLLLVP